MFPFSGLERIDLDGADLSLDPAWLSCAEADALFDALLAGIAWETHRIRMFGRQVDSPRLSCWIGDPGTSYTYSRTRFEPHPWPAALMPLRERLREALNIDFNSVLANRYRHGRDAMGWHSDDEPELGPQPVIASVSLGAARRFALKPRGMKSCDMKSFDMTSHGTQSSGKKDGRLVLELPHGSLLVMRGDTQARYRHALPATARPVNERINLTFRRIVGVGAMASS